MKLCWNECVDDLQLVELTNGETYNGKLVSCDSYMNLVLNDAILTTKVAKL